MKFVFPNIFALCIISYMTIASSHVYADWRNMAKFYRVHEIFSEFSTEFSQAALQQHKKNYVCSPVSVAIPLSMVTYGTVGETFRELSSALRLPPYPKRLALYTIYKIINNIKSYDAAHLYLANKMFISNKLSVKHSYVDIIESYFQSECDSINFGQTIQAAEQINNWCKKNTNNHIQEIIKSDDLDSETTLVLVNAIYFKGSWQKPFNYDATDSKPFFVNEKISKQVSMMHQKDVFHHGFIPYLDAEFISLPYEASSVATEINMYIILPSKTYSLNTIEKNIHKLQIIDFYRYSKQSNVNLYLPSFKIKNKIILNDLLSKMGINRIFNTTTDFREISKEPIKVTKVIQKTFIEVNESGTEAGASTAIHMSSRMFPLLDDVIFNANRPFIAIIASRSHVLFMAKIVDPTF